MVPELLALNAPPVLIIAMLLIIWNKKLPRRKDRCMHVWDYVLHAAHQLSSWPLGEDRDFLELFAGQGEVTRAMREVPRLPGYTCQNSARLQSSCLVPGGFNICCLYAPTFACTHTHTRIPAQSSLRGCAMDIDMDELTMNLLSPAGFASWGCTWGGVLVPINTLLTT